LWGSFQAARRFIGALWSVLVSRKRPVETGQQDESCPTIVQTIVAWPLRKGKEKKIEERNGFPI
jgi:hypothetical protein